MMLTSHAGRSAVSLGSHLGYCTATIRRVLRQFQAEDIQAIRYRPLGPAPDSERRLRIRTKLGQLLSEERTWSSRQCRVLHCDIVAERLGYDVYGEQRQRRGTFCYEMSHFPDLPIAEPRP